MKILYFTLLTCLLMLNSYGQAEEEQRIKPKRTDNFIRMDGIRLGTDLTRPFQSLWNKGDRMGVEFSADIELRPNIYPVAEAGWEKFTLDQDFVNYTSSGPYIRAGLNYNLLAAETKDERDILYIGFRYGISLATQEVHSYRINNYWGPATGSFPAQNYQSQWIEVIFGITGELFKNVYLGWSLRGKFNVIQKDFDMPPAYFNPGYGKAENSMNVDMTYSLFYTLPFEFGRNKKEKK
ncbi:MAG: DUF6048 family protein [Mangrovibacterium sp.]|nr:DUF6048 family protein [Mangrovibacterium sp.]